MSRIKLQDPNCETPEIKSVFNEIKEATGGTVPAAYRAFGLHAHILQANWNRTTRVLSEGTLNRVLKEKIALAVSAINGCKFCCHIHRGNLIKFGVSEEEANRVFSGQSEDETTDFVLKFCRTATKNPETITDDDFQVLKDYGYSDEDILEILTVMEMYTGYNKTIISLNLEIEDLTFKE